MDANKRITFWEVWTWVGGSLIERSILKTKRASETLPVVCPSHKMLNVCLLSVYFSETPEENGNHPIHTLLQATFSEHPPSPATVRKKSYHFENVHSARD